MGAPKTSSSSPSSGWRLGDNEKLMTWVKEQAAELAKPREFSVKDQAAPDLRVLFTALLPYEFARFKKYVVELLSEFSGFRTDTIQSFKTRLIFAKLKMSEMDTDTLDQICEYVGIESESEKIEQIDKLVNLLARPENTGLDEDKQELLLYLSRVENVKIPGSRRHLTLLKYPPRIRTTVTPNTRRSSTASAVQPSDENEDDDDESESQKADVRCEEDRAESSSSKKTKRRRTKGSDDPKEQTSTDSDRSQRKRPKAESSDNEGQAAKDDACRGDNIMSEPELVNKGEAKTKQQLRKTIRAFLEKSDDDVTMRMVKEHLLEHFGKDLLQTYKSFVKNTVMEIIERL